VERLWAKRENAGKPPAPDVVRELDGGLVMRCSIPIGEVEERLVVKFGDTTDEAVTTLRFVDSCFRQGARPSVDKIDLADHLFRGPWKQTIEKCLPRADSQAENEGCANEVVNVCRINAGSSTTPRTGMRKIVREEVTCGERRNAKEKRLPVGVCGAFGRPNAGKSPL